MKTLHYLISVCIILLVINVNAQNVAFNTLDINNVRVVFNPTGINFSSNYNSFIEIPKGSNNKTITCNTLWFSGLDIHGQLSVAGGTSSSTGKDYYPGPLTANGTASTDSVTMAHWNRVWKVRKQEIQYHLSHYGTMGYVMPDGIANWPAHGDTSIHQAFNLAPYLDINGDGHYTPNNGDYPLIRGDEAIFFIFNDKGGIHNATGGLSFGLEIHAMAYAFNCPNDSALNNTIFINYKIINRATHWYSSVLMGVYSDISIGNAQNDFIRSDIMRNSYYTYSGTNIDPVLGNYFPAQAVTILGGPLMDADGIDNPAYDTLFDCINCNEAVNGLNFGDGIEDNERFGMTGFISFNTGGNPINNEPTNSGHYSGYLQTKWKDGRHLQYGGYGYDYLSPFGPDCNFMYPALTDPCDWGTNGNPPNGSRNWTEETALNTAGDRHGLSVMGPLTLDAGDSKELDIAFIYGMDYCQPGQLFAWENVLNRRIDSIRSYFVKDATPCGGSITGISQAEKNTGNNDFKIYPNPTKGEIYMNIPGKVSEKLTCNIYNMQGVLCKSIQINNAQIAKIDLNGLANGMYQLVVIGNKVNYQGKVVKYCY